MTFNVNKFRASFGSSEPFKASAYEVIIPSLPEELRSKGLIDIRNIKYRCSKATLPTKSAGTTELKTYGPIRQIAYGSVHEDVTLTFILSDNLKERELFLAWLELIYTDSKGDVAYYDSYKSTVLINTYNKNGGKSSECTLIEAYPKAVGEVTLDWEDKNSISTIDVTFVYRYFEEKLENNISKSILDIFV